MPKVTKAMQRQVMIIDPTLQYERKLKYMEKHSGWEIFKVVFWGMYILLMGLILLRFNGSAGAPIISLYAFFGWGLTIFAIFYILWGLSLSLHLKLMRKYA
jgi:hypothetical protein